MFSPEEIASKQLSVRIAAGAVVLRKRPEGSQALVVNRAKMADTSLPKGGVEAGESLQQTIERELLEETGYAVRVTRFLEEMVYTVTSETAVSRRFVYWFEAELQDNDQVPVMDADEIGSVEWVALDEVMGRLSYENEKSVLARFLA